MNEQEKNKLLSEHPEYAPLIQFVNRKSCGGFWRTRLYTYDNPTPRQIAYQQEFAKINSRNYGRKGFSADGLPIMAHVTREALKNRKQPGRTAKEVNLNLRLENLLRKLTQTPKLKIRV